MQPSAERTAIIAQFRRHVWARCGYIPFPHQAAPILASEGWTLTELITADRSVPSVDVQVPHPTDSSKTIIERRALVPRPHGVAHTVADLGAYKAGKSFGAGALYAPGFAVIPNVNVQLVGAEYKTSRHEFEYLADTLLSKSQGMGMPYKKYQNDPRGGRMLLELKNGMTYEGMSWERKEALKGAEIISYLWNEAYMLPGMECIDTTKQNLRRQRGWNYLSTTPDRPWVVEFHEWGHGKDPDVHCTCGVDGSVNPYTFDLREMMKDAPEWSMVPASVVAKAQAAGLVPGGRMTRERFAIAWQGRIGDFVGRVYNYQRGERLVVPQLHPYLFRATKDTEAPLSVETITPADIRLPVSAKIIGGADTGTYMSALIGAAIDDWLILLEEFPNYRIVSGQIELLDIAIPAWSRTVADRLKHYTSREKASAWVDPNSQFKAECGRYGLTLRGNGSGAPELRTEILREYFTAGRVLLMPWLRALPWELEYAKWPDDVTGGGRYAREKDIDHTLDGAEHIASRRPRVKRLATGRRRSWREQYFEQHKVPAVITADPHLGPH